MTSNVPEIVAQVVKGFETINKLIRETQGTLGRFSADLRTLSTGGRGVNQLVESMEKLGRVKLNGTMITDMREMATVTREMQAAQSELARGAQQTAKAYAEMAAAARRTGQGGGGGGGSGGGMARPLPRARAARHVNLVDASIGLGMAGDAGAGYLERSLSAELEVQNLLTSFRQNVKLNDTDVARVRARAEELVRTVQGSQVAENVHTIMDAYTVVGDLTKAMAGSQSLAELSVTLKNLPGAHGGDPVFAAAQAVEVMQRMYDPKTHEIDIGAMNKQIAAMAQVAAGTGGRDGPQQYLALGKQARIGGMVANDQFLYRDAPAAMIALGGSRFGTGMTALIAQFETGTMTKNAAEALKKAGLLDNSAVWKGGRVQDMAHKFRGADELGQNMIQWTRDFLLGPNGALAKNKIDPNDKLATGRFLSSFMGRQTGLGLLAEFTLGMEGINKEGGKLDDTSKNPLAVMQATNPNMKLAALKAAENELMVQVGSALLGPAVEGMKGLTVALRDLVDWAKAHPGTAKDIALTAAGLTVLSKVAGELALAVMIGGPLVGGFVRLAGALTPFGAAGGASTALTTLAGAGGLGALATGVIGLSAAVVGTVGVIKGFVALNDAMGLKPGKGNGPSPHGNALMDGLSNWWERFSAPQTNPSTRARGGASPISYIAPGGGGMVQVHTVLYLDRRQVGEAVTQHQAQSMGGVGTGLTGFDTRMTRTPTGLPMHL